MMTINWFSSLEANQSQINAYYPIIQETVIEACPFSNCTLNFTAVRAVRVDWKNLYYQLPETNRTIVSFATYKYWINSA